MSTKRPGGRQGRLLAAAPRIAEARVVNLVSALNGDLPGMGPGRLVIDPRNAVQESHLNRGAAIVWLPSA